MKLKTRLIIAFFVIICVPLLLAGVSLVGFSTYQIRNLEDHLGISGVTYENMSDSVQVLNKATNSNFEQIKAKGSENPVLGNRCLFYSGTAVSACPLQRI